ncbi:MAG: excinuclease ABC subunit UvrA, partial [Chlamydiales bacterium]
KEEKDISFNLAFAVESTGKSYPEITPHTFAFNTAEGMCLDCMGLGYQYGANLGEQADILSNSIYGLLRHLWRDYFDYDAFKLVEKFAQAEGIDPYLPLRKLPSDQVQLIMQGSTEERWYEAEEGMRFRWIGINNILAKMGKSALSSIREAIVPLLQEQICFSCQGARVNALARHVTIKKLAIQDVCRLPISEALQFLKEIKLDPQEHKILEEVQKQLLSRLEFLCEVGLQYLSLERRAPTLSGGEAQRIRLARQLGSGLTGVLYVLDEPTIGLHPHDNARLNQALLKLKELGNTLILVEHDPLTIQTADYILDFGPQSGLHGGHIIARGTLKEILRNPHSLTGQYLSGRQTIPFPSHRRPFKKGFISINKASTNNLKNLSLKIPVGVLTCLTGVSGSGKSTLLQQILLPALEKRLLSAEDLVVVDGAEVRGLAQFDKVISIDQDPIGHTVRSDVGTYADVLPRLRDFFVMLPEARTQGLQPKHFSCNHRRGMCTACWGMGYRKVEMHFLPPVRVKCEECHGLRLNPVSLGVKYLGRNFGEYLNMTVDELRTIFQNHPRIIRILDTLIDVGLGYLKLGQESVSLSGGEAQRLKLSRELAKRSTGKTIYLLDEPTTGLHNDDILKLLQVLQRLVDKGNTMIMIEHHLDMIKNADYLIDLGPEAGEKGGYLVCSGTPEEVSQHKGSWTGYYLRPMT